MEVSKFLKVELKKKKSQIETKSFSFLYLFQIFFPQHYLS